jgi:uncharacterized phage protein (TIGR01671 family)
MQDRLKFRAWNFIVKRFQYFDLKSITEIKDPIQWHILGFQQCTGLKDKNGTLIYEGDIVSYKEHKGYLLPSFTSLVICDKETASFGFFLGDNIRYFSETDEIDEDLLPHMEVIGNVLESSELLHFSISLEIFKKLL